MRRPHPIMRLRALQFPAISNSAPLQRAYSDAGPDTEMIKNMRRVPACVDMVDRRMAARGLGKSVKLRPILGACGT
jgi:hypothetical protein